MEIDNQIKQFKKPICPECDSRDIRHLKKTDTYWCRRCGNVFSRKVQKDNK